MTDIRNIPGLPNVAVLAADHGLAMRPLAEAEAEAEWRAVLVRVSDAGSEYLPSLMRYHDLYDQQAFPGTVPLSMILHHDGRPGGIWPLSLQHRPEGWRLSSNQGAVLPPMFDPSLPPRSAKRLARSCADLACALAHASGQTRWRACHRISRSDLGDWYRRILERGATVSVTHELWCDLSPSLDALTASFRKSYKPLIRKARKLWQPSVLHSLDPATLEEIRRFHGEVAGRITRSPATWRAQADCLNAGEGFAVTLRDGAGRLVAAALFNCGAGEASYATGIYDRALFDLPLGHLVQALAIEEMKTRDLTWYRIGLRAYAGEGSAPSAKEQAIGLFKEGFASETRAVLETDCPCGPNPHES